MNTNEAAYTAALGAKDSAESAITDAAKTYAESVVAA